MDFNRESIMRALLISSTLILGGCLSNDILMSSSVAHQNVESISQLRIGMTQDEVYQIMRYPSREDQVTTDESCYDVWFYVTKGNILDQSRLVARNLTPLIFKDGILIGMGNEYYNRLTRKSVSPKTTPTEPVNPSQERENIELEKNLSPKSSGPTGTGPKKHVPIKPIPNKPKEKPSLSMSSKPKSTDPKEKPSSDKKVKEDSSEPKLDESDQEMFELEQEENFNDW